MSKTFSIPELKKLAISYGGNFVADLYPWIDFGGYGFESTELTEDGRCYGFRFFGPPEKMHLMMELWNELTVTLTDKKPLTIDLAFSLVGKWIKVSYSDINDGQYRLKILGIKKVEKKQIGQNSHYVLTCIIDGEDKPNNQFFEWQGIFRRGSGAERIFVEDVDS